MNLILLLLVLGCCVSICLQLVLDRAYGILQNEVLLRQGEIDSLGRCTRYAKDFAHYVEGVGKGIVCKTVGVITKAPGGGWCDEGVKDTGAQAYGVLQSEVLQQQREIDSLGESIAAVQTWLEQDEDVKKAIQDEPASLADDEKETKELIKNMREAHCKELLRYRTACVSLDESDKTIAEMSREVLDLLDMVGKGPEDRGFLGGIPNQIFDYLKTILALYVIYAMFFSDVQLMATM